MIIIDIWMDKIYQSDIDTINKFMKRLRTAKPGTEFELFLMSISDARFTTKWFTVTCEGEK